MGDPFPLIEKRFRGTTFLAEAGVVAEEDIVVGVIRSEMDIFVRISIRERRIKARALVLGIDVLLARERAVAERLNSRCGKRSRDRWRSLGQSERGESEEYQDSLHL